ncbi:septal ring lytic transglycosylase RlpA family protein [Parasphingopyxis algicola]|uniref:septal ring lytic transglycosylase RlpA family protein n=1 Tax=Parasphingopyxis algicola TaxID=2026624 RepID=UPI0015A157C1|nr:SPOR domain-containing protein [Parasphingopyxis algicola]QLC24162.1 septal ring lytic transglycosylase RlpA family protein [Parasphingopyxis algicola]
MQLFDKKRWTVLPALAALAACSSGGRELPPASAGADGSVYGAAVSDTPVQIGPPYTINRRTYTPADPSHYDEVGLASYYGAELSGRPTANGERFRPSGISAAHRTLPLPSYVEVTALQTGRTILVRVNDRGPFAGDRIIDLSVGAARQLGIVERGTAPVRVRRVQPVESDRARLRAGQPAQPRLQTSPQLLEALRAQFERGGGIIPQATPSPDAPASTGQAATSGGNAGPSNAGVNWQIEEEPQSRPVQSAPPAAAGDYYVQLGAFSNAANAQRLANRAQRLGTVRIVSAGSIRRVRLGPYPTQAAARQALSQVRSAGFGDARIFRDPAQ